MVPTLALEEDLMTKRTSNSGDGFVIICKIGGVINSAKNETQLYNAVRWYRMLCDRHLWLHHHKIKFDFITILKRRELGV
jgi:hypothetical protein